MSFFLYLVILSPRCRSVLVYEWFRSRVSMLCASFPTKLHLPGSARALRDISPSLVSSVLRPLLGRSIDSITLYAPLEGSPSAENLARSQSQGQV